MTSLAKHYDLWEYRFNVPMDWYANDLIEELKKKYDTMSGHSEVVLQSIF